MDITPQKPTYGQLLLTFPQGKDYTIKFGNEIREMKHLNHGKVSRVLLKELLLLILSYKRSVFWGELVNNEPPAPELTYGILRDITICSNLSLGSHVGLNEMVTSGTCWISDEDPER